MKKRIGQLSETSTHEINIPTHYMISGILAIVIGGIAYVEGIPFLKLPADTFGKDVLDFIWGLFAAACFGIAGALGTHVYNKRIKRHIDQALRRRKKSKTRSTILKVNFMRKSSPLIAAIVSAALIVLQQAVIAKNWDLKAVGIAVLIAVLGAIATQLKGKGASFWGIVGTALFTLVNLIETNRFTWNEFILTAGFSILSVLAPTLIPQSESKKEN